MSNNNNKSNKEYKNKLIVQIILNTMYKIDGDTLSTSCNISLAPLASDFSCNISTIQCAHLNLIFSKSTFVSGSPILISAVSKQVNQTLSAYLHWRTLRREDCKSYDVTEIDGHFVKVFGLDLFSLNELFCNWSGRKT